MDNAFFNGRLSTEAWLFLTIVYVTLNAYKNWKILNQLDFSKSEWYYLTIEVLFSSCTLHSFIAVVNFTSNIVLYFMFSFVRIFFYIFDFFLISNSLSFSVTSLLPIIHNAISKFEVQLFPKLCTNKPLRRHLCL